MKIAIIAGACVVLLIVAIVAAAAGVASNLLGSGGADSQPTDSMVGDGGLINTAGCTVDGAAGVGLAGYADQLTNAATIVAVGKQMAMPEQGWVVAIAAAMQESALRNVNHGDRDSLGLFQQRPSQGWGTPAQIMNPTYAATQFYRHLLAVPGWQQMSVNDAAQAVQRSGFPHAYGPHEQIAREIVAAVSGATCTTTVPAPSTPAATTSRRPIAAS